MEYERPTKLLILVMAVIVLGSVIMQIWSWHALNQIDSMSRNLNDAERPEQAFQSLKAKMDEEGLSESRFVNLSQEIDSRSLYSRLLLAGNGFYDAAVTVGYFYDAIPEEGRQVDKTARYLAHCKDTLSYCLENEINAPYYILTAAKFMQGGVETGGLHEVWENKTATEKFNNYLERAEYYDKRLRKGGFDLKPVEMAYYTDKGLYMVGSLKGNITIDNNTIEPEREGKLMYIDKELQLGLHRVETSYQTFDIKVHHNIPESGLFAGKYAIIAEKGGYQKVMVKGSEEVKIRELKVNQTIEISTVNMTEKISGNQSFYEVKLISPEVNKTIKYSRPDQPSNTELYSFGMTEEEYERFNEIVNNF